MDTEALTTTATRFPLIGEARPSYPRLDQRISEIAESATTAEKHATTQTNRNNAEDTDLGPGVAEAAHTLNKAALIASDCGVPDLARELCLRHIDAYHATDHTPTV